MKRLYTPISTLAFSALLFCSASAQNLMSFQDHNGNAIANGDMITYTDMASVVEMQSDVECAVNGTSPRDVNVKRYELNVVVNTENYFCWGLCYLPQAAGSIPVWDSQDPIFGMTPNTFGTDFHAYHRPNSEVDCMTYRYVWYDLNNSLDSSWLDIQFCSTPVGIDELTNPVLAFSVFPNPVNGNTAIVNVALANDYQNGQIVLHNALGEEVLSKPIGSLNSTMDLGLDGVGNGVYFCSISIGGKLVSTERLVVAKR